MIFEKHKLIRTRNATYHDAPCIKNLMAKLGYSTNLSKLIDKLECVFGTDDHQVYVCEMNKEVLGFVIVHYLPQLAFDGGLAVISYLSVDEIINGIDIADVLEKYVTEQAQAKRCERIQVHCFDWRKPTRQFYLNHGYNEFPNYFIKKIADLNKAPAR